MKAPRDDAGNNVAQRGVPLAGRRMWSHATFGVDLTEDEADAAGIATWALRRALLAQKTRAA